MKKINSKEKAVEKALIKKAVGYNTTETTEEFAFDSDSQKEVLLKKKVAIRHFAPDISAIKLLLGYYNNLTDKELENMSDDELIAERDDLLKNLTMDFKSIKGNKNDN